MHAVSELWQYHKQYFLLSPVNYLYLGWESKQGLSEVSFLNPFRILFKSSSFSPAAQDFLSQGNTYSRLEN